MRIQDVLRPDSIRIDLNLRDKAALVSFLAAECGHQIGIAPHEIADALTAREKLGSTGLGNGIAIPHARLPGLDRPFAFAIRLRKPIDFDAVDDKPVDVIISMLLPLGADAENLNCLASITRRLRDRDLIGRVRAATSSAALYEVLISSG
jgi:PTS system nitrogen regulatory IIA component